MGEQHRRDTQPLVERRDSLQVELARIESDLETKGIHFTDRMRELDRETTRLQALLPPVGPGTEDDEEPDRRKVERILRELRSDRDARSRLIAATPEQEEAARIYDGEMAEWDAWRGRAVQALSATGETDLKLVPSFASNYPEHRRRELSGGLL